ncbi:MAG: class I SAM-dependent methyltransferase [Crenarchaeota archaeon]|nr:MAG: class I SAM-dependent methyltransferase [Thermoproteota archaeon]
MNDKQIKLLEQIGSLFLELSKSMKPEQPSAKTEPVKQTPPPPPETPKSFVDLVQSEDWPSAVDPEALVQTEEDKYERAEGIIDLMIEHHTEGLKFLDFGCGEGHVSKGIVSQNPSLSVGYDIKQPENQIVPWDVEKDSLLLTTNLEKVKSNGPYDVILVYDVLDHCENPIEALNTIKSLAGDKGKIFVRCHPWCSRHGGHIYQDLNKAFAHLFLTPEEIKSITGKDLMLCQKVFLPQRTYTNWFKQVGFQVKHENTDKNIVENFFFKEPLKTILVNMFKINQFPKFQMEQSFLDYVLLK